MSLQPSEEEPLTPTTTHQQNTSQSNVIDIDSGDEYINNNNNNNQKNENINNENEENIQETENVNDVNNDNDINQQINDENTNNDDSNHIDIDDKDNEIEINLNEMEDDETMKLINNNDKNDNIDNTQNNDDNDNNNDDDDDDDDDIEIIEKDDIIDDNDNDDDADNDSNGSSHGSKKNNGYIVVNMDDKQEEEKKEDKEKKEQDKEDEEEEEEEEEDEDELIPTPTPQAISRTTSKPKRRTTTIDSDVSIASNSNDLTLNNKIIRANILCTWVPKQRSGSELTVIAGDIVTIIHCEPIQLMDNPLAKNTNNQIDKVIILKSVHWTTIRQRSGKVGIVPSNILKYDENPINNVWTKVKIQHSYMAKGANELTISSGERLQILGCVSNEGMITAKRKDGTQGLIPYNFVEIPVKNTNINTTMMINTNNIITTYSNPSSFNQQSSYLRSSVSSAATNDFDFNDNDGIRPSRSRSTSHRSSQTPVDGNNNNRKHIKHQHTGSRQLNFVIDDTMTPIDGIATPISRSINSNDIVLSTSNGYKISKKNKLTSRIQAIGASISTAIDKIQMGAYSHHDASKTLDALEPIPISSNMTTPSAHTKSYHSDDGGGVGGVGGDKMNDNAINETVNGLSTSVKVTSATLIPQTSAGFSYSAPLQWRKVFILKDFNGTEEEIERVYKLFILDKTMRGRHESILNYEDVPEELGDNDYFDEDIFNAAAPTKTKKTIKDVVSITTKDSIEICGDPSPEGWILARFCNDKEHKGFVPISYIQSLDDNNNNNNGSTKQSGIGALLQQHQLSHATQESGSMLENDYVGTNKTVNIRTSQSSTVPVTNEMAHHEIDLESPSSTGGVNNHHIITTNDMDHDIRSHSKTPLPFHWPFSTYWFKKRKKKSKIIESIILLILLIIYTLPIFLENPSPKNAPNNYYIWYINLVFAALPWAVLVTLRMMEFWSNLFNKDINPNNRLYAILLFYIVLLVYFLGLFAISIEVLIQWDWIRDNSPILLLATIVEIIVFFSCVIIICVMIVFLLIWTFCCRISRNRWETRIEFYCCTRGEPRKVKRYPRVQK